MKLDARTAPIHKALENYLEPKNLAYALRLWSEKFIEQPNLSLKMFVDSFYTRQTISMRSHELYNHLLPAMMEAFKVRMQFKGELIEPLKSPPENIPLVRARSAVAESELSKEPVTTRIELYEIFSFFIRSICNKIPEDRRKKLVAQYAQDIRDCCASPTGDNFLEWMTSEGDYFEDKGLKLEQMADLTHILYMGMCDYLGPVKADNILTSTVSTVDRQFPTTDFDIQQLL